jgi:hypothetical protein
LSAEQQAMTLSQLSLPVEGTITPVVELEGELTLSKSKCMCELSIVFFFI